MSRKLRTVGILGVVVTAAFVLGGCKCPEQSAGGGVGATPDLTVTAVSGPASAKTNATISVTDTTKNVATDPADTATSTKTWFYLSTTSNVIEGAVLLKKDRLVGTLTNGQSRTMTTGMKIPVNVTPGSYYIVDEANHYHVGGEENFSNNMLSCPITITY